MVNKPLKIPKKMQAIFWSADVGKLDLHKDKNYIIQGILAKGSLSDLRWLNKHFSKKTIKDVFIGKPQKQYTPVAFNFVSRHIIKQSPKSAAKKYVKNLY